MYGIFEAKLSADDRDSLRDNMFGLPKERKYPLNDENHIRKAIQFFKYCKPNKRAELASNINKRAKAVGMTIKVSKDSPFYKYADRSILEEGASVVVDNLIEVNDCKFYIYENSDIESIEDSCLAVLDEAIELSTVKPYDVIDIMDMNDVMKEAYLDYIDYLEYCGESVNRLAYTIVEDAKEAIIEMMSDGSIAVDNHIKTICECSNKKHAYRTICELIENANNMLRKEYDNNRDGVRVVFTLKRLTDAKDCIYKDIDKGCSKAFGSVDPFKSDNRYPSVIDSLEDTHNKCKNQLYIIDGCDKDKCIKPCDTNVADEEYSEIFRYTVDSDMLAIMMRKCKLCCLQCCINESSLIFLRGCREVKSIVCKEDNGGSTLHYAIMRDGGVGLICARPEESFVLYIVEVTENVAMYLAGLITGHELGKLRAVRFSYGEGQSFTNIPYDFTSDVNIPLNEAFDISEDGDIRITISPKQSYMDSYSQNHKMLVENWKNNNYDAVKRNLAFAFALISIIERSDEYKRRDPEMVKARAFLINDFKTYLKRIQTVEPTFDFVDYYRNSDYDKKIINVPKTTIIGASRLLKSILL